ncbi:MAG: aldehyde oxidase [Myxococcaceae bacterium]|nr:aldehyde oxidase [Myxococcaceae bacterium]
MVVTSAMQETPRATHDAKSSGTVQVTLQVNGTRHELDRPRCVQCGYCTPGQLCSALGLLQENRARTDDQVRELMSANLCRCAAAGTAAGGLVDGGLAGLRGASGVSSAQGRAERAQEEVLRRDVCCAVEGCVLFVDEPDPVVNPLGVRGLGEISIVGVAAALSNAIYHATGKRIRDLPITLDKRL